MNVPEIKHHTMAGLFLERAEDDNPALLFEDQSWSWRELVQEAAVRAAVVDELLGDAEIRHIGLLLENTPEYLFHVAGACLGGYTVVGVNPTHRGAELAQDISATDCQVLLTEDAHAGLLDGLGLDIRQIDVAGEEYRALLDTHRDAKPEPSEAALEPANQLLLLFTSGSTGAPKAVRLSTGRWATIAQSNAIPLTSDDVAYSAMPLFHGNSLMGAWAPTIKEGGAFAIRRKFSASQFLPDIQKFGATFFNYVGRSLAYILAQPETDDERNNKLRFGFGTEASKRDREEFSRRFECMVFESYGSSEGTLFIIHTDDTPDGALGKPGPGFDPVVLRADGTEAAVAEFGPNGELLNPEEAIGEFVSRGIASRFEGYYNNPEATESRLQGDDYHTGDLGYVDADGFWWFAGRTSDWLRVDSENLAVAPIERIFARFPAVVTAAVYGVPDPRTGDQVMAALHLTEDFDPEAWTEFLHQQSDLSTKSWPMLVRVSDNLPVTATQKINKPALRSQSWATSDPVWRWNGTSYELLDETARAALREEYLANDNAHLLPGADAED
ncbi:AMP-binding protein [Enemella sp. A6]|uniref:AMP-binding protein n=1 Tax=Enemella sp. A6 TaxID=3440152 RepID=UPI003EBC77D7